MRNERPDPSAGSRRARAARGRRLTLAAAALFAVLLAGARAGAEVWDRLPERPSSAVNDLANVIDDSRERSMESLSRDLFRKTGVSLVVLTLPSLDGESIEEAAVRIYERWGIGSRGSDEGALLLLAMSERRVRIEVGYGLEGLLPDGRVGRLLDGEVLPLLRQGRTGEGLASGLAAVARIVADEKGVTLDAPVGVPSSSTRRSGRGPFRYLPIVFLLLILFLRPRWLLPFLLGSMLGGGRGGGFGGGGFGGGFGGFGGGMSGGGGASRGF